jgi:hypothetical protein
MFGKARPRKRTFVDPGVQGTLIVRMVMYWFTWLGGATLMVLFLQVITVPGNSLADHLGNIWRTFFAAGLASLVLLPVMIVDAMRLSHRFAGPIVRLRREMWAFARGEQVRPVRFRKDDFFADLAEAFNAVVDRTQRQETQLDDETEDAGRLVAAER